MKYTGFLVLGCILVVSGCVNLPSPSQDPPGIDEVSSRDNREPVEVVPEKETAVVIETAETGENSTPVIQNDEGSKNETDTPEVPVKTALPVVIKRFNINQALKQIKFLFTAPDYPLLNKGEIFYITHDLDSDGSPEIFIPGIESAEPDNADFEYFSDFRRPMEQGKSKKQYYLYVFSDKNNQYALIDKIDLGKREFLKSCMKFYASMKNDDPVIIASTFKTRERSIRIWCIYKRPYLKPVSTLRFDETLSRKVIIEDIDSDGVIDIVIKESVFEEGVGIETYLSWLKWNGNEFTEFKYINIVRNLNLFLSRFKEFFLAGKAAELSSHAVAPEFLTGLDLDSGEVSLHELLGITEKSGFEYDFTLLGDIKDIALPEILDNPFIFNDERGYYFHLTFRMVYQNEISVIADAVIYLLKNPFNDRLFTFQPKQMNEDS